MTIKPNEVPVEPLPDGAEYRLIDLLRAALPNVAMMTTDDLAAVASTLLLLANGARKNGSEAVEDFAVRVLTVFAHEAEARGLDVMHTLFREHNERLIEKILRRNHENNSDV